MPTISGTAAPALGDLRALGAGDVITIMPSATSRRDWARYQDAISAAVSRGASVRQVEKP